MPFWPVLPFIGNPYGMCGGKRRKGGGGGEKKKIRLPDIIGEFIFLQSF